MFFFCKIKKIYAPGGNKVQNNFFFAKGHNDGQHENAKYEVSIS